MAVLKEPKPSSRIKVEGLPAKGTHVATCIDVEDAFNVVRPTFDDPSKLETVDLTTFYFGFRTKGGELNVIKSKGFKLSLHEKSALFKFLKSWNAEAPRAGFDTATMKGQGAQITVEHGVSSKGRTFANIVSVTPVMEGLEKLVLPVATYEALLEPQAAAEATDDDAIPF